MNGSNNLNNKGEMLREKEFTSLFKKVPLIRSLLE